MTALGLPRRVRIGLAALAGIAIALSPAGTRPAAAAKKPKPGPGGGGKTAALGPYGLHVRDSGGDVVLDPKTGAATGTFSAGPVPALSGTSGWFLDGAVLEARDLSSGTVLWTFSGDGGLTTAPVTANGMVYVGSSSGNVFALRGSTGEVVRTVNAGSAIPAPDEHNVSQPLTGMAVGQGHLVVPATRTLTVFSG